MNPGKRFEQKFRDSAGRGGFVLRIQDRVYMSGGRVLSEQSEADFLVVSGDDVFLVECKATNRPRLEFYNVKDHQEDSLRDFDSLGPRTHGVLAVEFYDREGYRKPRRMFLVPIGAWLRYKASSGRKSMPLSEFERVGVEAPQSGELYDIDFEAVASCG